MRRERTHVNIDGGAQQAFRADAGRQVKNSRSSCKAEGQEEKGSILRGRRLSARVWQFSALRGKAHRAVVAVPQCVMAGDHVLEDQARRGTQSHPEGNSSHRSGLMR